jgi:spermidine synthase
VPGQSWTFFEIDPVVVALARDDRFFTFLQESSAELRIVLGDARLSLAHEPGQFDLLVVDAFSSDAIPIHLVTREAVAIYRQRLASGGLLAFHISNLHLDLEPVLGALARDAELMALVRDDTAVSPAERASGKSPSIWLVMARKPGDLEPLGRRWRRAGVDDTVRLWTDQYSSLLQIFLGR